MQEKKISGTPIEVTLNNVRLLPLIESTHLPNLIIQVTQLRKNIFVQQALNEQAKLQSRQPCAMYTFNCINMTRKNKKSAMQELTQSLSSSCKAPEDDSYLAPLLCFPNDSPCIYKIDVFSSPEIHWRSALIRAGGDSRSPFDLRLNSRS